MLLKNTSYINKMAKKQNVVAIIPARGGSKGLPGKNIKKIGGKPMLHYCVKAALDAKLVDKVIVSTDDEEIAEIAKKSGADVPFVRPKEHSTDTATSEQVLVHCVNWLKENENYDVDIIVYLQVTDPFKKKGMIDTCVKKLLDNPEIDSAFAVNPTHKKYWHHGEDGKLVRIRKTKSHDPRQKDKGWWHREDTGVACATRAKFVMEQGVRLGDNVWLLENHDVLSCVDIHDDHDFWVAEAIIERLQKENDKEYYFND